MAGTRYSVTADGATAFQRVVGPVHLSVTGGFGSGTVTFQALDPGGNTVPIANGAFTALTDTLFDFPATAINDVRVNVTGSSTPTLVIWIQSEDPLIVGV